MPSRVQPSRALWPLTVLACLLSGLAALAMGMDANWDLRNYHYYNGWRLLNGLVERDVLMAQIASFYNPLLDVPYAWAAERVPAPIIGFALGALHGLNFALLFTLSRHLLTIPNRDMASALIALAGSTGAAALSELGTVFYDNVLSLGPLAAMLMVVAHWDELAEAPPARIAWRAALAGLPAGLAFGLKQPNVIFCVGLCLAFLIAPLAPLRRLWLAGGFGVGVLGGFAVVDGFWVVKLWRATGNPVFPYFNHIFGSPWALPEPYRDPTFLPSRLLDALTLGLRFPFDPLLAGEAENVDFRWFAVLALSPLLSWPRRVSDPLLRAEPAGWLLAASLLSYGLWLGLFCIYRYVIALEMLAPLLVVGILGRLRLWRGGRLGLVVVTLLVVVALTEPGDWLRVEWRERAVEATLPPVEAPALVVATGHEPLSFLVPLFPKTVRFIRIDSTFTLPPEADTPFRRVFRQAIAAAPGPIYALHTVGDAAEVAAKLAEYGLAPVPGRCREFTSPIGDPDNPYRLCLTGANVPAGAAEPVGPAARK